MKKVVVLIVVATFAISCSKENVEPVPQNRNLVLGYYLFSSYGLNNNNFWAEGYEIQKSPVKDEDTSIVSIFYELDEYFYGTDPVVIRQLEDTVYLITETYVELGQTFTDEYVVHYNPSDTTITQTIPNDFGQGVIQVMEFYSDPSEFPNN